MHVYDRTNTRKFSFSSDRQRANAALKKISKFLLQRPEKQRISAHRRVSSRAVIKMPLSRLARRVWIESITRWAIKRGRSTKPGAAPPGGCVPTCSLAVLEWVQRPRRVAGEEGGMSANSSACCQRWMIAVNICAAEQQLARLRVLDQSTTVGGKANDKGMNNCDVTHLLRTPEPVDNRHSNAQN